MGVVERNKDIYLFIYLVNLFFLGPMKYLAIRRSKRRRMEKEEKEEEMEGKEKKPLRIS